MPLGTYLVFVKLNFLLTELPVSPHTEENLIPGVWSLRCRSGVSRVLAFSIFFSLQLYLKFSSNPN